MFLENKSERIVKGIFIGGMLYFIGNVIIFLTTFSNTTSQIGHYITTGIFYLGLLSKPTGIIVIFKFLCDIVYKVLKALDKYNSKQY